MANQIIFPSLIGLTVWLVRAVTFERHDRLTSNIGLGNILSICDLFRKWVLDVHTL